MMRWLATVFYATDVGLIDVQHDLDEIGDLHDLIERGPHWDTVDHIEIVRSNKIVAGLTVERAEAL